MEANPPNLRSYPAWLSDELQPAQLPKSISAALLAFILEIIIVISFAALIFSGGLSDQLPYGVGFIIVGNAILVLLISLFSSYSGSIAISQDAPSAILALVAASIVIALPAGASQEQKLATVVLMMVSTTMISALIFLLIGYFKLGGLVRFLPYPVMGGFLAGTGWLLLSGGVGLMSGSSLGMSSFQPANLISWLPGLALGGLMLAIVNRYKNPLALPGVFALSILLFYLIVWLSRTPLAELSARGWLLGPFPAGGLWQFPLNPSLLAQVDWGVILDHIPKLLPVPLISVIALLLNANGLELIIKRDINLNKELVVAGLANLGGGLAGGFVGYHTISLSNLNHSMSGGKRLVGVLVSLALVATLFAGSAVFSLIPKLALGSLLVFLGLSLLVEWVYQAWYKFPKIDFVIIMLILTVIAWRGFMEGVALGLVLAIILFVVSYSRISVVKHTLSGLTYHSRSEWDCRHREILATQGEQLAIFILQGFIFFGTAHNLFEQVRGRVHRASPQPVRFVLLDFAQVSGLDSTGLLSFAKLLQFSQEQHFILVLSGLKGRVADQFAKGGFGDQPGLLRIFPDLDRGVEWCESQIIAAVHADLEASTRLQDYFGEILFSSEQAQKLIERMECRRVLPGQYLIRQGDESNHIYFIESGQITVQLESSISAPLRLETIRGGRSVGEMGLYLNINRSAAVVADQPSIVYCISKQDLELLEQTDPVTANAFHRIIVQQLAERIIRLTRAVEALGHGS